MVEWFCRRKALGPLGLGRILSRDVTLFQTRQRMAHDLKGRFGPLEEERHLPKLTVGLGGAAAIDMAGVFVVN